MYIIQSLYRFPRPMVSKPLALLTSFLVLMFFVSTPAKSEGASVISIGSEKGLVVPVVPPRSQYEIDCTITIDSTLATLSGAEKIVMANNTRRTLYKLSLSWPTDSLHSVEVSAGDRPVATLLPTGNSGEPHPIIIDLPDGLEPGAELQLTIRFAKKDPVSPGSTDFGWDDWFPRLDWGMHSQDDYTVKLKYPPEYVIASSGLLDPAAGVHSATGVRQYGIYLARDAQVMERCAGDVNVRIVHTLAGTECAKFIMETAVDAINYYRDRFGFYPSNHLDIIPGDDNPKGGYPAATSLVVIHGMERMSERKELHWRWITAHEIGHQYWYEYVLSQPPTQIGWLMIGLGIYVDREYMRARNYPPDKHKELIRRYTDGVREGLDTRADVHEDYLENIGFDFNNVVIHGKGYSIISALDCLFGDSLFDRIHGRCLKEYGGQIMSAFDFQSVCEEESNQDLDWFFDQWVHSTPFLSYQIASQECNPAGTGFRSDILVKRDGTLDMPVPITAYFADSTSQTIFTSRQQLECTVHFESTAELTEAVIDTDGELAMVIPPPSSEELEIRRELSDLPTSAELAAIPELVQKALSLNIEQTLFWGVLGRRLYDWGYYDEALAVFRKRTELLEEAKSEWLMSAYGWQGLLLDLLGRRDEAVGAYKKARDIETDREFAYQDDPVTIKRDWIEERLKTPFQRPDQE